MEELLMPKEVKRRSNKKWIILIVLLLIIAAVWYFYRPPYKKGYSIESVHCTRTGAISIVVVGDIPNDLTWTFNVKYNNKLYTRKVSQPTVNGNRTVIRCIVEDLNANVGDKMEITLTSAAGTKKVECTAS